MSCRLNFFILLNILLSCVFNATLELWNSLRWKFLPWISRVLILILGSHAPCFYGSTEWGGSLGKGAKPRSEATTDVTPHRRLSSQQLLVRKHRVMTKSFCSPWHKCEWMLNNIQSINLKIPTSCCCSFAKRKGRIIVTSEIFASRRVKGAAHAPIHSGWDAVVFMLTSST